MYKTRTRADLLRGLADNQGLANNLAEYQTRYGDWRELFKQLDKVDKVSKADIRRVANQIFVTSNRTEAWIETAAPEDCAERWRRAMKRFFDSAVDPLSLSSLRTCFSARRAPGTTGQAVGADSRPQAA